MNSTRLFQQAMLLPALLVLNTGCASALPMQATETEAADTVTVVDASHYRVYTSNGTPSSWEEMVRAIGAADAILVGEYHNDPVVHYLEAQILAAAIADTEHPVAASMEMFTSDVQGIIDEYLSGLIPERQFLAASQPWGNYETDYRPFVEVANEAGIPVIAANAPRRYVNRVTRMGPESLNMLSDQAKSWLPPLPYSQATPAYRAEWMALMSDAMAGMTAAIDSASAQDEGEAEGAEHEESDAEEAGAESAGADGGHAAMAYVLNAQSLWDASMAYSIANHLTRNPGDQVVHIVGGFHVRNGTGIPEHLARYRPGTTMLIIAVEPVADLDSFDREELSGVGDFVILADESLPRSQR